MHKNQERSLITNKFCWICHQTYSGDDFKPCLCKGTMSFVHQSCLNRWASEMYGCAILTKNFDPISDVKCPNCKHAYNYNIIETMKFQSFGQLKFFDSKEKITLLLLVIAQIFVLYYDVCTLAMEEDIKSKTTHNLQFLPMSLSHFLHLGTVFILLTAAMYNLIDMVLKRTEIQILSKL